MRLACCGVLWFVVAVWLRDRRHAGRVVFLFMCSVLCKFKYSSKSRKYFDTLDLEEGTTIEEVCYKLDEFLI